MVDYLKIGLIEIAGIIFIWIFAKLVNWLISPKLGVIVYVLLVVLGFATVMIYTFKREANSVPELIISNVLLFIFIILFFSMAYSKSPISSDDYMLDGEGKKLDIYDSLYFSVVTLTTLGYGDIEPHGFFRAIASLQALLGYVFLGLLVANITRFTK